MASPPAEAVPEDSRSAPAGTPGSPARISSLEQAQELLAGEGLAEVAELAIGLNQFDDACERSGKLFDLFAAARHPGASAASR